jgi:hypothetical protein
VKVVLLQNHFPKKIKQFQTNKHLMKKAALSIVILICMAMQASAQGMYIEFKMTGSQSGISGTSKAYSSDGNTRSEINITAPQMPGGGISKVSLILKSDPKKVYMLDDKAKTYTETEITASSMPAEDPGEYEVTLVGKEKVNGYNCTHVKLKRKTQTTDEDVWVSTEVLNYKMYTSVKSKYTSAGLFKAMADKGAIGFLVRITTQERGTTMQVDLVKSEMRSNPASLFSLDGYTKQETASTGANPSSSQQDMVKKIQSMTPEERQKFIDQLRNQNAPH